uniref:Uncharacterized protein n=1 Tax=Amphimedon queenslandica TaxID=400682 RepID=A0A1X7SZ25_AMPQE
QTYYEVVCTNLQILVYYCNSLYPNKTVPLTVVLICANYAYLICYC